MIKSTADAYSREHPTAVDFTSDEDKILGRGVTVAEVAAFLGVPVLGSADILGLQLHDVVDDSRSISPGGAYVAIPGQRWHGLDFEDEAVLARASVVISDRPSSVLPSLVVGDPRAVVGPLAAWFHHVPSRQVRTFGVTGTNGKTSTAHFADAGLAAAGETTAPISGARIRGPGCDRVPARTTPEAATLQRMLAHFRREGVTACALEVSSHAISQHRVDGTNFRTMAFTNLSHDHLDYHRTMAAYYATKAAMFTPDRTEIAVVNIDDEHGARLASNCHATTWTCSTVDPSADVFADNVSCSETGSRFTAHTTFGTTRLALQVMGAHQIANALLALTSLAADGIDIDAAADGISALSRIPGRCESVCVGQPFTAIVDYMHNAAGYHALLPYLRSLTAGRLIAVIGATGGRDCTKRQSLGEVAACYADIVIVTDESPEDDDPATLRAEVLAGARRRGSAAVFEEPNRHLALELAVSTARADDVVVVAGRGNDSVLRYGSQTRRFNDRDHLRHAMMANQMIE